MASISERLGSYSIIGLDTSIFIYQFESHPLYQPLTHELLLGVESGKWEAVTSIITLMEISVRPLQLDRQEVARQYEALLVNFPHLKVVDLDRNIIRQAAQLRANYHLRPADAIQVSACLMHRCEVFITNDIHLAQLRPLLDITILKEFITQP